MATELMDVIDTAVKIGLGALISGIATYSVSAMNHKKEVDKTIVNKKINMLEDITEHIEKYFYFGTALSNSVGISDANGGALGKEQLERIETLEKNLSTVLESRSRALSKIKILSINAAEDAVMNYNDVLSEFRDKVYRHGTNPSEEEINEFTLKRLKFQGEFYKSIGNYIESISS